MTQVPGQPNVPPESWFFTAVNLERARADEALGGVAWAARRQRVCVHRLRRALGLECPSWVHEPPLLDAWGVALNRAVDDEALGGVTWAARRQRLPVATVRRSLGMITPSPAACTEAPALHAEAPPSAAAVRGGVRHFTPRRRMQTAPRRPLSADDGSAPGVLVGLALPAPRPARWTRAELRSVLGSLPEDGALSRRALELRHVQMRRAVLDSVLAELIRQGAISGGAQGYRRVPADPGPVISTSG